MKKGIVMVSTKFRKIIGSLTSGIDTVISVCMCVKYQSNPKKSQYNTTKRILKYLKRTINIGL